MREIARAPLAGRSLAPGLAALLEARGLALELVGEALIDTTGRRRAVWALALVAADMAAPGAVVKVAAADSGDGTIALTVSLSEPAPAERVEGVSLALASWIVAKLGSAIELTNDAEHGSTTLRATLPAARDEFDAAGPHRALTA